MTLTDPNYKRHLELQRQLEREQQTQTPIDGGKPEMALQHLQEVQEQKRNPHKARTTKLFDEVLFRATLPPEMLAEKRFVRFFLKPKAEGGTAKIPLGNHADPQTWDYFDNCVKALDNEDQGIGYCFLGGDIQAVDVDHCRNPKTGIICPEAKVLLMRLDSWAEYSVSGNGLHIFFKGDVRGKQLIETCLQFWNAKNSPRFFALTCKTVENWNTLRDIGDAFNRVYADATRTSLRIREELQEIDPEQWAALPAERNDLQEMAEAHEKPKRKTRVVRKDFDIRDYCAFNKLPIINEADNDGGHWLRLGTCPLKGAEHAGHNSTTTNFVYPSKDGGIGFHCQSTGCNDKTIHDVIKALAEVNGVYEKGIYEDRPNNREWKRELEFESGAKEKKTHLRYLWQDYLPLKKLIHFAGASGAGKSPVSLDLAARISAGLPWPDGTPNTMGPRSVILMCSEDDWGDTVRPRLELVYRSHGHTEEQIEETLDTKIHRPKLSVTIGDTTTEVGVALKEDLTRLVKKAETLEDLALVIIDPITNYLQGVKMNSEEEVRQILMPLVEQFITPLKVTVITIGHLNRREKGTEAKARVMGAAAFYGVARFVYMFGPDKELEDKFSHIMVQDRGIGAQSIKYKTEVVDQTWDGETSKVVRVVWGEKCDATGQDAVDPIHSEEKTQITKDAEFLKEFLRDGAKPAPMVQQTHEQMTGRKVANWDRVRERAKVGSRKMKGQGKNSPWEWYLKAPHQAEFDHDLRDTQS